MIPHTRRQPPMVLPASSWWLSLILWLSCVSYSISEETVPNVVVETTPGRGTDVADAAAGDDDNNNNGNGAADQRQRNPPRSIECGIYLAPSSIPHAGLGMFVGNTSFDINDIVTTQDVVIPIIERTFHTGHLAEKWLFDEYIWNADVYPGMEQEAPTYDDISAESAGVGSAANSYLSLVNVEDNWIELSRGKSIPLHSPGMGASTIYHGRSFYATVPIRPGQEIFVDYGTSYFRSRKRIYGYLPLPRDYNEADKILERGLNLTIRNERLIHSSKQNKNEDLEKSSLTARIWNDLHDVILHMRNVYETSRILNAVPYTAEIVPTVMEEGGTAYQHLNRSIMDLSWLEENGQCMDNIKVDDSAIPHAGRGAFATRFIPEGGLVAPAPLIHIPNHELMIMYENRKFNPEGEDFVPDLGGNITYQLIFNYCFVHNMSTVALFPYGMFTNLINHASPPHVPNTKIQWSQEMRHKDWLEKPIEEWGDQYHTGLQIDFVALRDIEKDEEILIDYGEVWQRAWDLHSKKFVSPYGPDYMPSYELNSQVDQLEMRIYGQDRDYELDHVMMYCRWWYLRRRGIRKPRGEEDPACRVIKKLGEDSYLVQVFVVIESDKKGLTTITPDQLVWGLPRDAFYFEDIIQTRDMHQPQAFRHPMMIPNDMFPEVWKNYRRP